MKYYILLFTIALTYLGRLSEAQIPTRIVKGQLLINDGSPVLSQAKYKPVADSLDKLLASKPNDTTSLFFRALLYDQFNNQLAKPSPSDNTALINLTKAKDLCEKAISLKMKDFRLQLLRAQIYRNLVYRYSGDESWKFDAKQIAERRSRFNNYKNLANTYYSQLEIADKDSAYDYQALIITGNYKL